MTTSKTKMIEIPEDVIERVTSALNQAIMLATRFEPALLPGIMSTAIELDEAVNDSETR